MPSPILVPDSGLVIPADLVGRSIAYGLLQAVKFWGHHRVTLAPAIDPRLTVILDELANAVLLIQQIIRPGPD